jgi:hypothetical protein
MICDLCGEDNHGFRDIWGDGDYHVYTSATGICYECQNESLLGSDYQCKYCGSSLIEDDINEYDDICAHCAAKNRLEDEW